MFEEQIIAEQNRVKQQVDKDTAYNFQDLIILLSSSIFYSNYVIAEVDYANYLLIGQLSNEKYFSEESLSSSMSRNSVSELLLNFSSLDNAKINKLIDESVELYVNFSLRPITSLFAFIFQVNETISKTEFLLKLAFFPNSNPIAEIFLKIAQENESEIINQTKLLNKFYLSFQDNIEESNKELILELVRTINNMLKTIECEKLFLPSLIIFFDNLHLYTLSEKLNGYLDNFENFNIDLFTELLENDFADDLILSYIAEKEEETSDIETNELTETEEIAIEEETPQESNDTTIEENLDITVSQDELDSIEDEFKDLQQDKDEN